MLCDRQTWRQLPATLKVVGEIKAGAPLAQIPTLHAGEAVAIMTGAPAPEGADAVVMVEYTSPQGDRVQIKQAVEFGANIVATGSEAKQGGLVLSPECVWIMRPFRWLRRWARSISKFMPGRKSQCFPLEMNWSISTQNRVQLRSAIPTVTR